MMNVRSGLKSTLLETDADHPPHLPPKETEAGHPSKKQ